jgi:hypothetical protein
VDPVKELRAFCRELGLEFHAAWRPGSWKGQFPGGSYGGCRFYEEHPEWHCRDADGTEVARMSFAWPEVRDFALDLLREFTAYEPDGLCLFFHRGVPLLLYEEPFADSFRKEFGEDPRMLGPHDKRVLAMRAAVVTAFMRDLRSMLDRAAERTGRPRIKLSAFLLPYKGLNAFYGLDVEAWIREKLIDVLIPFPWEHSLNALGRPTAAPRSVSVDVRYYDEIRQGTDVALYPCVVAWATSGVLAFAERAAFYYACGADGITIWDAQSVARRAHEWSFVKHLGHADLVTDLAREVKPAPPPPPSFPLVEVNGTRLDTVHHAWVGY